MPDGATAVKKGRKYDQVLEGARAVFMVDGFDGASVDDIARAANVSKATLYSYFPDKRFLFMQVAQSECQRQANSALASIDMTAPVRIVLSDIGLQMVNFITSKFGQQIFRICVAESARFPDLGREFYESGPKVVHDQLVAYFDQAIARGELQMADRELAAEQFHELCKADLFPRMVFNLASEFTDTEKMRVVDGAVEMFISHYGT